MSEIFSLRIKPEKRTIIENIARIEKRSMNNLINTVLDEFINAYAGVDHKHVKPIVIDTSTFPKEAKEAYLKDIREAVLGKEE